MGFYIFVCEYVCVRSFVWMRLFLFIYFILFLSRQYFPFVLFEYQRIYAFIYYIPLSRRLNSSASYLLFCIPVWCCILLFLLFFSLSLFQFLNQTGTCTHTHNGIGRTWFDSLFCSSTFMEWMILILFLSFSFFSLLFLCRIFLVWYFFSSDCTAIICQSTCSLLFLCFFLYTFCLVCRLFFSPLELFAY